MTASSVMVTMSSIQVFVQGAFGPATIVAVLVDHHGVVEAAVTAAVTAIGPVSHEVFVIRATERLEVCDGPGVVVKCHCGGWCQNSQLRRALLLVHVADEAPSLMMIRLGTIACNIS